MFFFAQDGMAYGYDDVVDTNQGDMQADNVEGDDDIDYADDEDEDYAHLEL